MSPKRVRTIIEDVIQISIYIYIYSQPLRCLEYILYNTAIFACNKLYNFHFLGIVTTLLSNHRS